MLVVEFVVVVVVVIVTNVEPLGRSVVSVILTLSTETWLWVEFVERARFEIWESYTANVNLRISLDICWENWNVNGFVTI